MLSINDLTKKWSEVPYYGGGYIRIDASHPLEWYIGYEGINQKTLLLIVNNNPGNIASSKSIIVSIGQRQDSKWAIIFQLIKKDNEDVFIHLCWDIIESSREKLEEKAAIDFVIKRYNRWMKLMEFQRSDLMNEARRKGLIGELLFLQEQISNGINLETVINGWIGPEGADQDFMYSDGWTEIKCIGLSAENISISSIEQLDAELPGSIYVYFCDKTSSENSNGFTLMEKVEQLRVLFSGNKKVKEILENKLFLYGYIDKKEYNEQKYYLSKKEKYKVDENFPRIIKNNIPSQIISASYNISLSSIENWKL